MTEPRLVKIGEASRLLGATAGQLRKWEATGELRPNRKTRGGTRYYAIADLLGRAEAAAQEPLTVLAGDSKPLGYREPGPLGAGRVLQGRRKPGKNRERTGKPGDSPAYGRYSESGEI